MLDWLKRSHNFLLSGVTVPPQYEVTSSHMMAFHTILRTSKYALPPFPLSRSFPKHTYLLLSHTKCQWKVEEYMYVISSKKAKFTLRFEPFSSNRFVFVLERKKSKVSFCFSFNWSTNFVFNDLFFDQRRQFSQNMIYFQTLLCFKKEHFDNFCWTFAN